MAKKSKDSVEMFVKWIAAQVAQAGDQYGSQSDAAKSLGLKPYEINKMLRVEGRVSDVRISTLAKIAKARGQSLPELAHEIWDDESITKGFSAAIAARAAKAAGVRDLIFAILNEIASAGPKDAVGPVVKLLLDAQVDGPPTKAQRSRLRAVLSKAEEARGE